MSLPYTVRDVLGTLSNQATATIDVRGADIATTITGMANAGAVCALPVNNGPVILGTTSRVNTYYPAQTSTGAGSTQLTLGPAPTGAGTSRTPINVGDLLLIIQMQGADISTTNDDLRYGSGQGNGTSCGPGNGMLGTNLTAERRIRRGSQQRSAY